MTVQAWNLTQIISSENKTDISQDNNNAFQYETYISKRFFSFCVAGSSLVSVEDSAEASFLTYTIEPLEGKTSTFWTGMYRNVDGNFFSFDIFLFGE